MKTKNKIRRNIVEILSTGINDNNQGIEKNRRVLNAIEIQNQLKIQFNENVGKSNVYFHLGILEDLWMIKVVKLQIKEGRGQKYMSYY